MSSAPHTSARISRKYLRNSWPRCSRAGFSGAAAAGFSTMASTGFNPWLRDSLYDFVRAQQNGLRHFETERFGGLEVHDQLVGRDLLDRQIAGPRPLEDLVHVGRRAL